MAGEGSGNGPLRPRHPGRRDLLRVASLFVLPPALLAAGCDIRLEHDAPGLPAPQRRPVPDEAVLVDAARRTTALGQLAGRVPDPSAVVALLGGLHRTQAEVLRGRLVAAGVPSQVIDGPTTPTTAASNPTASNPTHGAASNPTHGAAPTAAVSAPPSATEADLARAEAATAAALLPALPPVTAADRAVLVAVVAACATAADQLGTPVAWPATDPLPAAAALPLLDDTRAAGYALVVVAAQSSGEQRAKALTTRTQLAAREAELVALAGTSAPPPPLGYALPFPVTDPDSAARLATLVLTSLVAGGLAPLTPLPAGSMAVVPLVRFLVGAAALARTWGVGAVPFPGLVYP